MLNDFLFEIACAEEIGDFRTADSLDKKLIKLASTDYKALKKKIKKKYSNNSEIKSVDYSPSQKKFIISTSPGLPSSTKRELKELVSPYAVSFRYSNKDIDTLMGDGDNHRQNYIIEKHLREVEKGDKREPGFGDLRTEEEFPADDLSEDPYDLDRFWLEFAREDMKRLLKV